MPLISEQELKMVQGAMILGLLSMVVIPAWAGENRDVVNEEERTARIQNLQREQARVESELHQLRSQPEGVARSSAPRIELSDQPTRSMKESLESLPGVSAWQGSSGRDVPLSIRRSK